MIRNADLLLVSERCAFPVGCCALRIHHTTNINHGDLIPINKQRMLTVLRLASARPATLCGHACGRMWVRSVATAAAQEKGDEYEAKGKPTARPNILSQISSQLLKGKQVKG